MSVVNIRTMRSPRSVSRNPIAMYPVGVLASENLSFDDVGCAIAFIDTIMPLKKTKTVKKNTRHVLIEGELYDIAPKNMQPTSEQFARLDEKTAGAIKNLGDKMEAWAKSFDAHVEEDRQLRREFSEQQRQFDRMTDSLNAISKQLGEMITGFSSTVKQSTAEVAVLRADVESLKSDKAFRDLNSNRKEAAVKRWISAVGAFSAVIGIIAGHFWK